MRRIVIIDHDNHSLVIDDVDEEVLENEYDGDEQAYIDANYWLGENYSWDWITEQTRYVNGEEVPFNLA